MILDVDSKAPSVGITSPPLGFVTKEFLSSSSSLLSSHGQNVMAALGPTVYWDVFMVGNFLL